MMMMMMVVVVVVMVVMVVMMVVARSGPILRQDELGRRRRLGVRGAKAFHRIRDRLEQLRISRGDGNSRGRPSHGRRGSRCDRGGEQGGRLLVHKFLLAPRLTENASAEAISFEPARGH
jgi:hypothetical protein